jgi:hypothetical protein
MKTENSKTLIFWTAIVAVAATLAVFNRYDLFAGAESLHTAEEPDGTVIQRRIRTEIKDGETMNKVIRVRRAGPGVSLDYGSSIDPNSSAGRLDNENKNNLPGQIDFTSY